MTVEFWFLIGAALVFWMQAGFAMVETGFTRAKNAGNIIMLCFFVILKKVDFLRADPADELAGLIDDPDTLAHLLDAYKKQNG